MPGAGDQPRLAMRLEVINRVPQCREVRVSSSANDREVRQRDLSAVRVAEIVTEVYAMLSAQIVDERDGILTVAEPGGGSALEQAVQEVAESRKGRGSRKITNEFLAEVAETYRSNINGNPAKAVEVGFGVSPRMAGVYIRKARDLGLLPETTGGKKRA